MTTAQAAVLAIALSAFSGFVTLLFDARSLRGQRLACSILSAGAILGIFASLGTLFAIEPTRALELDWPVPNGQISIEVDAISAVFLFQIFFIGMLGSIYALRYWRQSEHQEDGRKLACFYGLTVAGMALLVVAKNSLLFLVGWETMAIGAFFMVSTEDRLPEVREASFVYVVATRFGTLFVIAVFCLLAVANGSFTFARPPSSTSPILLNAIFILALFGFGTKAGMMPLHVWLPGAHANAPTHVSALMSGVLIKMGIYALVRFASFFADPPLWWGAVILSLGVISGVLGVAYALAQHDLKRLLAYHSIENIGIILMGLGLAMMGRSLGRADLVVLGIAGALLHVVNHGLFKALLFLSAGSVVHATGTRAIDRLGGLLKRMPKSAAFFLIGAVAICGLPPLNGFVSELFIYLGLFHGALTPSAGFVWLIGVSLAAPSLALIGALAVACFVKVFGAVFLGAPRSEAVRDAHDPKAAMILPQAVLAIACTGIGVLPLAVAPMLDLCASTFAESGVLESLERMAPLEALSITGAVLVGLIAIFAVSLRALLFRHPRGASPTWDCGYAAPSARMQYTASSFAEMLVKLFGSALRPKEHKPEGLPLFPKHAEFESHVGDAVLDEILIPVTDRLARLFTWFRWLQRGSIHTYLLYILLALFLLHFFR